MKFLSLAILVICGLQASAQTADIIRLGELQEMINRRDDKIVVINFWATWCGPCVKELPYFEKLTAEGRDDVLVTLVSMDLDLDPDPGKVRSFIERKKIRSTVVLLNEQDPDSWINKVDETWSGALPATLIVNRKTGQRKFVGKALREGDLVKLIEAVK